MIFKLTLLVFAGAIINVAVAWGCAIWGTYERTPEHVYSHEDKGRWIYDIDCGIGITRNAFVPDNPYWVAQDFDAKTRGYFPIPYWSRLRTRPSASIVEDGNLPWYNELGFGWPLRTAVAELCNQKPARSWFVVSGIQVLQDAGSDPYPTRVLPINPIFPGFAINTIFYAAIVWMLVAVPGAVRRRLRHKRGQCASCGYSLRGTPDIEKCPECGTKALGRAGSNE